MSELVLREHQGLPEGLLEARADALEPLLGGPTLIHLPGRRPEPLFVSILLHGNEHSGLAAVQQVLRNHAGRELPRACSIFVGNVAAARAGLRRLDDQPDYNRVWPGSELGHLPEGRLVEQVVERMRERRVFASIDIHNNTGLNPHYACLNALEPAFLHLALLFSRIVVYFRRPLGVQSAAFARLCPAVTVECGKTGTGVADGHAASLVEAALRLSHFPDHAVAHQDIDLFHTVATVKVPEGSSMSFDGSPADLRFVEDLDHMNFRELAPRTIWARCAPGGAIPLEVTDEDGQRVTARYFSLHQDKLVVERPVMPSMLTRDAAIVRQDCLCYLMERLPLPRQPCDPSPH